MGQPRRQNPARVTGTSDGRGDREASQSLGMKRRDLPLLRRKENTSSVFGPVFVRNRNVISHLMLFSRDCHMIAITLSPE